MLLLKILGASASEKLSFKQIIMGENQSVSIKKQFHNCFFCCTFTDTGDYFVSSIIHPPCENESSSFSEPCTHRTWEQFLKEATLICFALLDIVSFENNRKILGSNTITITDNVDIVVAFELVKQLCIVC